MSINRKLLEIIDLWDKSTQKDFHDFLSSPYFNKGAQASMLIRIYNHILKFEAKLDHPKLKKHIVANLLFAPNSIEEKEFKRLDKLGTALLDLAELYLAQKDFEARRTDARILLSLMKFYRKQNQDQRFWQAKEAAFKALESSKLRDLQFFLDTYDIHIEISNNNFTYATLKRALGLDQAEHALEQYFVASKLSLEIAKAMQSISYNAQHQQTKLTEGTIHWVPPIEGEAKPAMIELQQGIIRMLAVHPSIEEALLFEQKITAHKHVFPFELTQFLYTCIRGVLSIITKQFPKELPIQQQLFPIHKRHLEEGYSLIEGKIGTNTLRVCLTLSLDVGEFAWAKNLLESFTPDRIYGTNHPKEFWHINWAYYYFQRKEYMLSEQNLLFSNFENQVFAYMAEVQLIEIYYETQNVLIESRMKALDKKLRRSTQTEQWKLHISGFLKYLDKIIRLKTRHDPAKQHNLIAEIKKGTPVYRQPWLLDKLNELDPTQKRK